MRGATFALFVTVAVCALTLGAGSCDRTGAKAEAPQATSAANKVVNAGRPSPAALAQPEPAANSSPNPATVGALFGDKTLSSASPENIAQKVATVATLKSESPQDGRWTFRGEGSKEFPLATAQFDEVETGRWQLAQLYFVFRPTGGTRTFFDTLTAQLRTKLGKPKEAKKTGPTSRRTEWKLGKSLFLAVEESVDPDHGPAVDISLNVPDGDPD
jgi:hypothetical protein